MSKFDKMAASLAAKRRASELLEKPFPGKAALRANCERIISLASIAGVEVTVCKPVNRRVLKPRCGHLSRL